MTAAVAVHVEERARRAALSLRGNAVAIGLIGLLCAALVAITWRTWGNLGSDTGYDFVTGANVAHGEVPYADFLYYYGPLPAGVLGAGAWVGGTGVGTFVVVGLLIAAAIVGVTYALARRLAGPVAGVLAAAIVAPVAFAPNLFGYVLPYSTGATLGILTLLVLLLALARGSTVAAGIAFGLVALTKPEFEAAALCATAAWLVARGASWRRETLVVGGLGLAIPAAVYGAFLSKVSLHDLVLANLYPRDFLRHGGNAVLKARAPMTLDSFVTLGGRLVLYAVGIAALVGIARVVARPGAIGRLAVACVGVAVVGGVALSAARPGLLRHGLQFAYGWIPAGAVVAAIVLLVRRRDASQSAVAVALAVLAATSYASFFLHSTYPQAASYAAPLAAVFLVVLHLRSLGDREAVRRLGVMWLALLAAAGLALTIGDARAKSATVHGPGGTLQAAPGDAAAYGAALGWIERRTRPGDAILLAPQISWLYTVADRQNPLHEISLLPGVLNNPAAERAAIRELVSAHVRLAVIDARPYTEYGAGSFGVSFDRTLAGWIRRNFVRAAVVPAPEPNGPHLQIWIRRLS